MVDCRWGLWKDSGCEGVAVAHIAYDDFSSTPVCGWCIDDHANSTGLKPGVEYTIEMFWEHIDLEGLVK